MSRKIASFLIYIYFIIMVYQGPPIVSADDGTTAKMASGNTSVIPTDVKPAATKVSDDISEMKNTLTRLQTLFDKSTEKMVIPAVINQSKILHPGQASKTQNTTVVMFLSGGRNYRIYREPELPFSDAYKWCQDRGMQLLTLENKEANDALEPVLTGKDANVAFWTSGIGTNAFAFTWKAIGKPFTFTKFAAGEPNNADNSERCINVGRNEVEIGWYDAKCEEKKKFICEIRRF